MKQLMVFLFILFSSLVFGEIPLIFKSGFIEFNTEQADILFEWGVSENIDFFMLLDDLIPLLENTKTRLRLEKPTISYLLNRFDFDKWRNLHLFLPLEKLTAIEIGYKFSHDQNPLDLFLLKNYSGKSPLGDFSIDKHFGFKKHKKLFFLEAFGIYTDQFYTNWSLDFVELYEPRKISLHIKGFFRPKKYDLHPLIIN